MTKRKTISSGEKLINWSALSKHLTNSNDTIRQNRIPKVHEKRVEQLISYLNAWVDEKTLINPLDIEEVLSNFDLKTKIMTEIDNLH
jgi:hypothetical protein|nr:MAG TPA: hypothetical protein [Caudoviricetes sp.]